MIRTPDIFKAAYLTAVSRAAHRGCRVEIGKNAYGGTVFALSGEEFGEWETVYLEGWAVVAVADFKSAFCDLLIMSGQSIRSDTKRN